MALGELADDLIRRMPPALPRCHGAALLPALTGITVAQHLDHYGGTTSQNVAIYCNLRSHLQALLDFLALATWCDDIAIFSAPRDAEPDEQLFRYFGMAFLILDQIIEDLRDIWDVLGRA